MAAAKTREKPQGRGREIAGVILLGLAIFSALSLVSMQAGEGRLMGPGGAATATGLYSAAGLGSYLLIMMMSVVSMRCFRATPLTQGFGEVASVLGMLGAASVLLHLPFAGGAVRLRGPGGLLGQWLGEVTASFIGSVGAALAATTLLSISLLVLTNVRVQEVLAALAWAGGHLWAGVRAVGGALGRMVVAMFPEKGTAKDENDDEASIEDDARMPADAGAEASDVSGDDDSYGSDDSDRRPIVVNMAPPFAPMREMASEAVSVGEPGPVIMVAAEHEVTDELVIEERQEERQDDRNEPSPEEVLRAHMAALVAEVAAVECATSAQLAALDREPEDAMLAGPAGEDYEAEAFASPPPIFSGLESRAEAGPVALAVAAVAAAHDTLEDQPVGAPVTAAGPVIVDSPFLARQGKPTAIAAVERPKDIGPGYKRLTDGEFILPATSLLEYQPQQQGAIDEKSLREMAARLERAMANYGVKGAVTAINLGPVVTMYEFQAAEGTRLGRIKGLEADLALSLAAKAVRIEPIPGKTVVGVEVPNQTREMVFLKEIMEDHTFTGSASKLQVALGKDIKGAPVTVNLAKMPHLLVAGTTGSGKSVTVNGMITSILFNATPEEVRFIMVDPKMLELSVYAGIPHLLLPVVTDAKKANLALHWAVEEMERRYELLSKAGVRDIISYNAKLDAEQNKAKNAVSAALDESPSKRARRLKVIITDENGNDKEVDVEADSGPLAAAPNEELREQESARAAAVQAAADAPPPPRKLPYVVIVIDEFADLMMVAPKDVETSVARLAQKARAAGLHLILATQRPSVDVITGLIKANFPSRIALQVASKIDSRTILDQPGAETLLGNGDMLFSDRGLKLKRIHGAFLSDDEVHRVVDSLKKQAAPVYDMDILKPRDEDAEDGNGAPANNFSDDVYDKAIAYVCEARQVSVSSIQRRFQIGYNRAARIVEQMERDGIVGAPNVMKQREVLAPSGDYLQAGA